MPWGMELESDINVLIGFESGGELFWLLSGCIYSACHLSIIYILLARMGGCCSSRREGTCSGGSLWERRSIRSAVGCSGIIRATSWKTYRHKVNKDQDQATNENKSPGHGKSQLHLPAFA